MKPNKIHKYIKVFIQDPYKIPHYLKFIFTQIISGYGTATIPLKSKICTSSFSEYLSVYGLMPSEGEVNMILNYLENAKNVFDIGANVGVWSVLMSKANPNSIVHSFEPNPETFSLLQTNIKRNNCSNVIANNYAVSDTTNTLEFQIPENASILGRLRPSTKVKDDDGRFDNSKTIKVQSLTLADYCKQHSVEKIDFLKIDIEGHELAALIPLESMLRNHYIKAIHIETIEANHLRMGTSYKELLEFIESCGYKFCKICNDGLPSDPISINKIQDHNHICVPR